MERGRSPVDEVRKEYGLRPLGSPLEVVVGGDLVLFADAHEMVPTRRTPPHHHFLGPIHWSPPGTVPPELRESGPPLIYATLGSSGDVGVLDSLISALGDLPVRAAIATAGRARRASLPPNVRVYDYLPGSAMARRSHLVVSNGGSPTGYQALAEGTPVVGIASNMDQYLAMTAIVNARAGHLVKARAATRESLRMVLKEALQSPAFRAGADTVAQWFSRYDPAATFPELLTRFLNGGAATGARIGTATRDDPGCTPTPDAAR